VAAKAGSGCGGDFRGRLGFRIALKGRAVMAIDARMPGGPGGRLRGLQSDGIADGTQVAGMLAFYWLLAIFNKND